MVRKPFRGSIQLIETRQFHVVTGNFIGSFLSDQHDTVIDVVRSTYLQHHALRTINPDSYFLRFPDNPDARIIALPAALTGDNPVSGIKWIASYPANVDRNLQRASATLVLNDHETGYPFALLEASQISAARTAASCVLAAEVLTETRHMRRLALIGAGPIARSILDYFRARHWTVDEVAIHALNEADAGRLAEEAGAWCARVVLEKSAQSAIRPASHVVLATTAAQPHLRDADLLSAGQIILNISLRDLDPALILGAFNIFDDIEHCMKASTSPHLAEQLTGDRGFVNGVLAEVIQGSVQADRGKPIVFSPFGLGVLDLALGQRVFEAAVAQVRAVAIDDFFPSLHRWS